eukprot:15437280-Alexandrium_andersonii.AAC.1
MARSSDPVIQSSGAISDVAIQSGRFGVRSGGVQFNLGKDHAYCATRQCDPRLEAGCVAVVSRIRDSGAIGVK